MSCTKEEFVADYIKAIGSGEYTPEQFEDNIEGNYSIKAAEELAEQEKLIYIDSLWDCYGGEDNVSCDKETFTDEYEAYAAEKGDSYVESEFGVFIQDKYPVEVEVETPTENTSSGNTGNGDSTGNGGSNGNGNTGNGGSSYTPPVQTEPVYTPPAQTTPVTPVTPPSDNGGGSAGGGFSDNGSSGNTGSDANEDDTPDIPPGFEWGDAPMIDVVE